MNDISLYLPGILMAYAAFTLATLSPGPAFFVTTGTSMSVGRRSGIMVALGVVAGSFSWAAAAIAGVSAVLATYAGALTAVRTAGGLYLGWLALKALRSAFRTHAVAAREPNQPEHSQARYFLRGWLVQISNPKSILGWISIISLGLRPGAPAWVAAVIVAGSTIMATLFYGTCAMLFSTPSTVRVYNKARRPIDAVLGLFFVVAAVTLLTR
jgi:amino acid exporter